MLSVIKSAKLYVCMLGAASLMLVGCDDSEILGTVAIGAGVIAVCSSDNVHCGGGYHYYNGRRIYRSHSRNTRRSHRNRVGNRRGRVGNRSGRVNRGNRGNRGRRLNFNAVNAAPVVSLASTSASTDMPTISELGTLNIAPSDWSATFDIKLESSVKVIDALEQVRLGNPDYLATLGLIEKDMKRIAKMKMLKESGIERMSASLGESPEKVEAMLKALHEITEEELAAEAN